jgi:hypothetical protein
MVKKIEIADDCWVWVGAVTSRGYGSFSHEGRIWSTHRLSYELLIAPIPDGLTIDHLCRNKVCCNPDHLEPVTALENQRRDYRIRFPGRTPREKKPSEYRRQAEKLRAKGEVA